MTWLDWEGTKIIIRTLRGGRVTTPDQPDDDAVQRAQEAAAPTQADAEAQGTPTVQDDGQDEPQPA